MSELGIGITGFALGMAICNLLWTIVTWRVFHD